MSAISKAKETLLRALDELEKAEQQLEGDAERVDLVVTYSIGRDLGEGGWSEIGGWASTPGPQWMHAAMLRRAADAHDSAARAVDDEEGQEP